MSDSVPSLSVPPPGWYQDLSDPGLQRWWDGTQWTEHTASNAPAEASVVVPEPVIAAEAFPVQHVAPPEPAPIIVPSHDGHLRGYAPPPTTPPLSPMQLSRMPSELPANTVATRGMIFSLVSLALNPLLIVGIIGIVQGVRGLRRAPNFLPERANKGQAIAAVVVGAFSTVLAVFIVAVAVWLPFQRAQQAAQFDQLGVQQEIQTDLQRESGLAVARVDCPANPSVAAGSVFNCVATMGDARTVQVILTIKADHTYSWVTKGLHDFSSHA